MKNILEITFLLFVASPAVAQNTKYNIIIPKYDYGYKEPGKLAAEKTTPIAIQPDILFNQYDLQGASYIEVANCVANSDVAFYSAKGGGKVIKTATADKSGKLVFEQPKDFNPGFVVNLKNRNSKGVEGNGMVNFASVKLFSLQNVQLEKKGAAQVVLSWKVQVNFDNAVINVQKSTDGDNFKTISTMPVEKLGSFSTASYTDADADGTAAQYRLVLVNNKQVYPTSPLQLDGAPGFTKVYPSPATDNINVTLAGGQQGSYVIVDNAGKTIRQGKLSQKSSRIAITDLASGIYFIKITSAGNKTETKQFIKN